MIPDMLFKGIVIGFSLAAPVGPIGLLCVHRTLSNGRRAGLVAGLGAATAHVFFAFVAALGFTSASALLIGHQSLLRLAGGTVLIVLGIRIIRSIPSTGNFPEQRIALSGVYASTLFLTLSSPISILYVTALLAGFGAASTALDGSDGVCLVLGVGLGSALWWLTLNWAADRVHGRLTPARLTWLNRIAGATVTAFGLIALSGLKA